MVWLVWGFRVWGLLLFLFLFLSCFGALGGSASTDSAFFLGSVLGVVFWRYYFSSRLSSLLFPAVTYFRKQERILHMASSVKTLRVKIAHGDLRHDANTLTGFVELSVNADGSDTIEDIKKKIAVRSVLFVLLRAFFFSFKVDVRYSHYPHPNEYKKKTRQRRRTPSRTTSFYWSLGPTKPSTGRRSTTTPRTTKPR